MRLRCPVPGCGAENPFEQEACTGCGAPLQGYARLTAYPSRLFNQGLAAARSKRFGEARDLFAAVVHWCPFDLEARNALALASLELGDVAAARCHWELVLFRRTEDPLATQGLAQLRAKTARRSTPSQAKRSQTQRGTRKRHGKA